MSANGSPPEIVRLKAGYAEGYQASLSARGRAGGGALVDDGGQVSDGLKGVKALWTAVIVQAVMDAKSRSSKQEMAYHRTMARHWLADDSEDFPTVCELAGMEPQAIRHKFHAAEARGFHWRNAALQPTRARPKRVPFRRRPRAPVFLLVRWQGHVRRQMRFEFMGVGA